MRGLFHGAVWRPLAGSSYSGVEFLADWPVAMACPRLSLATDWQLLFPNIRRACAIPQSRVSPNSQAVARVAHWNRLFPGMASPITIRRPVSPARGLSKPCVASFASDGRCRSFLQGEPCADTHGGSTSPTHGPQHARGGSSCTCTPHSAHGARTRHASTAAGRQLGREAGREVPLQPEQANVMPMKTAPGFVVAWRVNGAF